MAVPIYAGRSPRSIMPYVTLARFNRHGWAVDLIEATCNTPHCRAVARAELPAENAPFTARDPLDKQEGANWLDFGNWQRKFYNEFYLCPACATPRP